jgi:hypothetical protein
MDVLAPPWRKDPWRKDQSDIGIDGDEPVRSMLLTMTDNMLQGRLPKWFLLFFLLGACTAPSTDSLVGRYEATRELGQPFIPVWNWQLLVPAEPCV